MIYIATTDEFEEYTIEGVFDSKEKAELWIKIYGYKNIAYKVEEYPLNPGIDKLHEVIFWIDREGNKHYI